jgi:hypothetical protein
MTLKVKFIDLTDLKIKTARDSVDVGKWVYHPDFGAFVTYAPINHAVLIERKMGYEMSFGRNYDSVEKGYAYINETQETIKLQTFQTRLREHAWIDDSVIHTFKKEFPNYDIVIPEESESWVTKTGGTRRQTWAHDPAEMRVASKTAAADLSKLSVGSKIDSWSVLQYVRSLHPGYDDDGRITQYEEFEVKEVPLDQVDAPWETSEEAVEGYASLLTVAPPIVLDHHNTVIDGTHRVAAAYDRGETTITALVPFGDPESFPTEEEESENALRGLADVD